MTDYLLLFVGTVLVNNFVLVSFSVSVRLWEFPKSWKPRWDGAGNNVCDDAGVYLRLAYRTWILIPLNLIYLRTLAFILVLLWLCSSPRWWCAKPARCFTSAGDFFAAYHHQLCSARRGLLNINLGHNFLQSALYGFSALSVSRW